MRVEKKGRHLLVNVRDGNDERVQCKIPIKSAISFLESYDGVGFKTSAAVSALRHARFGTMVEVHDDQDHVKVRLY